MLIFRDALKKMVPRENHLWWLDFFFVSHKHRKNGAMSRIFFCITDQEQEIHRAVLTAEMQRHVHIDSS